MDYQITQYLNHLGSSTLLDLLTKLISSYYFLVSFWLILVIIIFFLDRKNFISLFFILILSLIIDFLITDLFFKHGFLPIRTRPYLSHPNDIIQLGVAIKDSSFPSGHMASTLALSTGFVYFYRKFWPWALIFAFVMAFARVHNGMHYPTDVLAGGILGFYYSLLAIKIFYLIKNRYFGKM